MDKTYRISNDGTIFEIKDDGSIARLAKIDDKGQISTLSGTVMTANGGSKGGYWFFIVLFAIAAIILGVLYAEADDKYSRANRERNEYRDKYENASSTTSSLRSEISSLRQERDNAKSELSKISSSYPIIINDISIANTQKGGGTINDYGYTIYSSNARFLTPRIKYRGLCSGTKTLKVKWYLPNGSVLTGTTSSGGYSQSHSVYISSGENTLILEGWGWETPGNYKSGSYRIEIWYENTCLKSKTFTIY